MSRITKELLTGVESTHVTGILNSLANLSAYNQDFFYTSEENLLIKLIHNNLESELYQTWISSLELEKITHLQLFRILLNSLPNDIRVKFTNQGYLKHFDTGSFSEQITTFDLELSDEINLTRNIEKIFETRPNQTNLYLTKLADIVTLYHPSATSCHSSIPLEIDIGNCNDLNSNQIYQLNSIILPNGTSLLRRNQYWYHSTMLTELEHISHLVEKGCFFIYQSIRIITQNPTEPQYAIGFPPINPPILVNYGNTCFISSVVWNLANLLSLDPTFYNSSENSLLFGLLRQYQKPDFGQLFKEFTVNQVRRGKLDQPREQAEYRHGQHDVAEFLGTLINYQLLSIKDKFENKYRPSNTCYQDNLCPDEGGSTLVSYSPQEHNLLLQLPFNAPNLSQILENELKEKISGTWNPCSMSTLACPNSTEMYDYYQFGQVVIIQIGRYSYDRARKRAIKNNDPIIVPLLLNLGQFNTKKEDVYYQLSSCIIHIGDSANSGHYTAVINSNNNWYYCDDTKTRIDKIAIERVQDYLKRGTIFFYQQLPKNIPIRLVEPTPTALTRTTLSSTLGKTMLVKEVPPSILAKDSCYQCKVKPGTKLKENLECIKDLVSVISYQDIQMVLDPDEKVKSTEYRKSIKNTIDQIFGTTQVASLVCKTCQVLTQLIRLITTNNINSKDLLSSDYKLKATIYLDILKIFAEIMELESNFEVYQADHTILENNLQPFFQNVDNYLNQSEEEDDEL